MVDTYDDTAIGSRDYSKVHAEVIFGMGITKRTFKIPIMSLYVENEASFKLKLQEPAGALIGNKGEAVCKIRKTDENFKIVEGKLLEKNNKLFGVTAAPEASSNVDLSAPLFGSENVSDGSYINMDSVLTGEPFDFSKSVYSFSKYLVNENSYNQVINDGKGYKVYLEDHTYIGGYVWMKWGLHTSNTFKNVNYDYAGIQLDWSCSTTNADISIHAYDPIKSDWYKMYGKSDQEWNRKITNLYFDSEGINNLWFYIRRYVALFRTSPTITFESIKPILRKFKVYLRAAEVPALLDENGNLTKNHKYTNYANTKMDYMIDNSYSIGYSGRTMTVELTDGVTENQNPFYIKQLDIVSNSGKRWTIAKNQEGTYQSSISFKLDSEFFVNNKEFLTFRNRTVDGMKLKDGEFTVQPVLGVKPSTVCIKKSDKVKVKIWNDSPVSTSGATEDYNYRVKDTLHFTVEVLPKYASEYKCDELAVYQEEPYSTEWIKIEKPLTSGSTYANYIPFQLSATRYRIEPLLSKNDNEVIVKVPADMDDKFDHSYGIFASSSRSVGEDGNIEYAIAPVGSNIVAHYFAIKARCIDENYVPVWKEINGFNKYAQETYWFLGQTDKNSNIINLTCEQADNKEYTISGITYYEETSIGSKTSEKSWQISPYANILIDDTHFAYSDANGKFSTIPGKGINGYCKKYAISANGSVHYGEVKLNQDHPVTKTIEIEYETGPQTITKDCYEIQVNEVSLSNSDIEHPHVNSVTVANMHGYTFSNIVIDDIFVNYLTAYVSPKNPYGENYQYTYTDEFGNSHTEDETIKRVEFVVMDPNSHKVKRVVEATMSNAEKTEWTATAVFEKGNYNSHAASDRLYARIVTDRKQGDGKGYDVSVNPPVKKDIPYLQETTYPSIFTNIIFKENLDHDPTLIDIEFPADRDKDGSYSLPFIGELSTMINALGMSFGVQAEGDRYRLFLGKKFNAAGNRYDDKGKTIDDNGYEVTLKDAFFSDDDEKKPLEQMREKIKSTGKKRLGLMSLTVPTLTFEPIVGVFFEFMIYRESGHRELRFTGGGGYIGAILDLRFNFYFLVVGIPCYAGIEGYITFEGEFGVAIDEGEKIVMFEQSQYFFDELLNSNKTHFEFIFRAQVAISAYLGVGIAGTIGLRGGFQLKLNFIYNPCIKKKYSSIRPVGFSITGAIKIWADVVLCSIPIPVYTFWKDDPLKYGYFKDLADYQKEHGGKSIFGSAPESVDLSLKPRPRFGNASSFVANNDKATPPLFGGTFVHDKTKTLIKDSYDASEPTMMKFNENDILLVYLDDNKQRGDLECTELMYMIYYSASDTWSEPKKVCETSDTADFSPNLCDCGDKILLSWCSRENVVDPNDNKKELLKNMEIYAVFFDKTTETFEEIEKITDDSSYDYHPIAACDRLTGQICLYYLKKQNVMDIENSNDLLNQVQTEVNGAYLMYMIYDDPVDASTGEYHWVRDYYYPGEIDPSLTPEEKAEFINTWKGQRFANLAINSVTPPINNPNISDYAVDFAYMHNISNDEIINFLNDHGMTRDNVVVDDALIADFNAAFDDKTKLYLMIAYVVDKDGDVGTKNDSDVFLAIYDQYDHSSVENIRISNNNTPDNTPKLLKTNGEMYLFWSENESMVKMFSISEAKYKSTFENHTINDLISGNIGAMTTDLMFMGDKITNFVPFTDNDDNIYIAWQENSQNINSKTTGEGEIEFKEDLYVAGLVKSIDNNGNEVKSWSNAVRFTNNQKVNDLPTVTQLNNKKLLLVDNSYNLKSVGDNYDVTNSELQAILMTPASSLDVVDTCPIQLSTNNNGSINYDVKIGLKNTGLYAAKGYDYSGNITYDGSMLTSFSGSSNEVIIPGGSASIGGPSINASVSEITPNINITLTNEQVHHIDKVKLHLNVIEKNVGDTSLTIDRDLFDVKEEFAFSTIDDDEVDSYESGDLRVRQNGDNFTIEGVLVNTGNIDTKGNERIYVTASDVKEPIYVSDHINLPIKEQMQFSIPLDKSKIGKVTMGIKDLCVYVMNDEGKFLSTYENATLDATKPYNFKLNNSLEKITLKVGQTLAVNATYEPSDRFGNGTILFCTADTTVANVDNGVLTAVNPGITLLCMTTKEYGGTKNVQVEVLGNNQGGGSQGGGRHSGGGGGGGGGGSIGGYLTGPKVLNKNVPDVFGNTQAISNGIWAKSPIYGVWQYFYPDVTGNLTLAKSWVKINDPYYNSNLINGAWYFFDDYGVMKTGWVKVMDNGVEKWYYLDTSSTNKNGTLLLGPAITPDGYFVGADGVWDGKGATYNSSAANNNLSNGAATGNSNIFDKIKDFFSGIGKK